MYVWYSAVTFVIFLYLMQRDHLKCPRYRVAESMQKPNFEKPMIGACMQAEETFRLRITYAWTFGKRRTEAMPI
jgi:hypothetical protein